MYGITFVSLSRAHLKRSTVGDGERARARSILGTRTAPPEDAVVRSRRTRALSAEGPVGGTPLCK